jgi:hypothetical protein
MAYTGTTPQVWVRVCEGFTQPSGPAFDCAWIQVYRSVFDIPEFDVLQLNEIIAAGCMLFAMIFIVAICKKAIEQ